MTENGGQVRLCYHSTLSVSRRTEITVIIIIKKTMIRRLQQKQLQRKVAIYDLHDNVHCFLIITMQYGRRLNSEQSRNRRLSVHLTSFVRRCLSLLNARVRTHNCGEHYDSCSLIARHGTTKAQGSHPVQNQEVGQST